MYWSLLMFWSIYQRLHTCYIGVIFFSHKITRREVLRYSAYLAKTRFIFLNILQFKHQRSSLKVPFHNWRSHIYISEIDNPCWCRNLNPLPYEKFLKSLSQILIYNPNPNRLESVAFLFFLITIIQIYCYPKHHLEYLCFELDLDSSSFSSNE